MNLGKYRWQVYAGFFLIQLPLHATSPLVALRLTELGESLGGVGLVLSIAGAMPMILATPLGRMTDAIGPSAQVIFGCLLCVLGYSGQGAAWSAPIFGGFLALAVLGHTASVLAFQSFAAGWRPSGERVRAFGRLLAVVPLAQLIGPPTAGLVADHWGYASAFRLAAVITGLTLLGALVLRSSPFGGASTQQDMKASGKGHWWKNRPLLFAASSSLLAALCLHIRLSFLPIYLAEAGRATAHIGLLYSIMAAASLGVRSILGRIADRLGTRRMVIAVFLLAAPALAAVPLAANWVALIGISIMLGLANGIVHPVTMVVATSTVNINRGGSALGVRYAAFRLGNMASPALLGIAASVGGLNSAFAVASALAVFSAIWSMGLSSGNLGST